MPDPIQCRLDRSQPVPTFDCEPVEIGLARCPSQTLDIGLAVAATASGSVPVAILAGAKVGVDLAQCLAPQYDQRQDELTTRAAEQYCVTDGGEPRGWIGNRLQCVYQEATK